MKDMVMKAIWTMGVCSVLTLPLPTIALAHLQQSTEQNARATAQLINELETLPLGRDLQFYHNTLEQRGYRIVDTRSLPPTHHAELNVEKDGQ